MGQSVKNIIRRLITFNKITKFVAKSLGLTSKLYLCREFMSTARTPEKEQAIAMLNDIKKHRICGNAEYVETQNMWKCRKSGNAEKVET